MARRPAGSRSQGPRIATNLRSQLAVLKAHLLFAHSLQKLSVGRRQGSALCGCPVRAVAVSEAGEWPPIIPAIADWAFSAIRSMTGSFFRPTAATGAPALARADLSAGPYAEESVRFAPTVALPKATMTLSAAYGRVGGQQDYLRRTALAAVIAEVVPLGVAPIRNRAVAGPRRESRSWR